MKKLGDILYETFTLLLEYDLEKTIKQHGDKALKVALERTDHDSYLSDVHGLYHGNRVNTNPGNNRQKAMNELMSQFEEADPTPQKKYVQHIARMYGNGGFDRHEDVFSRGKQALRKFHDLASRKVIPAENRDIGRIKSLRDLEDLVDQHKDKLSGKQEDAAHHEKMKQQATITEHGTYTHIIPHTTEASCHFGKGTKWCTATDDPDDSMHNAYSAKGPLQIFVPKEPKHPGEKYQYHYSSDQLMNEMDRPQGSTGHNDMDVHIHDYRTNADNAHQTRAGFDHPEGSVRRKTLKRYWDSATSEDLSKTMEKGLYGMYDEDHIQENDPEMGESPLYHPKITPEHISQANRNSFTIVHTCVIKGLSLTR
jgi:hypothetical protein